MQKLKKTDIILIIIIAVVLVASIVTVSLLFFSKEGGTVTLTVDGTVIYEQSISEDCEIPISTINGYNKFVVKNGEAYIEEADCPEQICVNHAPISGKKQSIVCLPHKLVVEIN